MEPSRKRRRVHSPRWCWRDESNSYSNVKQREGVRPHPRGAMRPSFASLPALESRGRRESRVRAAPAVSCAICTRKCAHEHTGSAEASRLSLRSGFTAYFVLSPVNGSFATVAAQIPPRNLTPAPRRQDHTTSPYASVPSSSARRRPPHPIPTTVTIMIRPSGGTGWRYFKTDLGLMRSGIFLILLDSWA